METDNRPPQGATAADGDLKDTSNITVETQSQASDHVVPTTTLQFITILIALILCIFCVALDNTIIVTAIPRITDDYKTLTDVGW